MRPPSPSWGWITEIFSSRLARPLFFYRKTGRLRLPEEKQKDRHMVKINSIEPIADSGITSDVSSEIFDQIAMFAGYGFNKSHAAAYASVSFQTAYLKTHHPECYFAAAMNLDLSKVEQISSFASQLKSRDIMLWAPDINMSIDTFRPVKLRKMIRGRDFAIAYALSAIRGVGRQAAQDIVTERNASGLFENVKDFTLRMGARVNRKAALALVHAGAFDKMAETRADAALQVDGTKKSAAPEGQLSMFDMVPELDTVEIKSEYATNDKLDREFDVMGHYHSDHPLREMRKTLFDNNQYFSGTLMNPTKTPPRTARMPAIVSSVDIRRTKSGDTMAIIVLSDPDRSYEALAFGDTWSEIKYCLKKKARVEITANVIADGPDRRFIIESACPLLEAPTASFSEAA
jgi:DNA polymerase-3 subunit alpha